MAKWDSSANGGMDDVKRYFNATNGEMDTLRGQIAAWADRQRADATGHFPFRTTEVHARLSGGWIINITYGDR